jgi:hypothetical protein
MWYIYIIFMYWFFLAVCQYMSTIERPHLRLSGATEWFCPTEVITYYAVNCDLISTPCSSVGGKQRFGGKCCLHLQSVTTCKVTRCHNPENHNLHLYCRERFISNLLCWYYGPLQKSVSSVKENVDIELMLQDLELSRRRSITSAPCGRGRRWSSKRWFSRHLTTWRGW